jgi:hypothetical protein
LVQKGGDSNENGIEFFIFSQKIKIKKNWNEIKANLCRRNIAIRKRII